MSTTATTIRNDALTKLGVIEPGDTPETAHSTLVDAYYAKLYNYLVQRQVATWGSSDAVPDYAADCVTTLLAANCAHEFEVSGEKKRDIKREAWGPDIGDNRCAMTMLRELTANRYVYQQVKAEYF